MKFQSLSEPETYFVIYCLPVDSLKYTTFHINTYSTDKITFDEIGYNNRQEDSQNTFCLVKMCFGSPHSAVLTIINKIVVLRES